MTETEELRKAGKVLVIGGLDPSGGAGLLMDYAALSSLGVAAYVTATAVTAQNSGAFYGLVPTDPDMIRRQMEAVLLEGGVEVVKTGLLPTESACKVVSEVLEKHRIEKVVADPVMSATKGTLLVNDATVEAMVRHIFPRTLLLTPNKPEAERLSGLTITREPEQIEAARRIRELGPEWVLVKGGHNAGREAKDGLAGPGYDGFLSATRLDYQVRGTGCLLASLAAGNLALQMNVIEAVEQAKKTVAEKLKKAVQLGEGSRQITPADLWEAVH